MKTIKKRRGALLGFLSLTLACSIGVHAKNKVMNKGYDVVAYHHMMEKLTPQTGNSKHTTQHEGKTYTFMSEKNKKEFMSEPQMYVGLYESIGSKGQDMVAYHMQKEKLKPAKGKKKHQWNYEGMTYLFKNTKNRDLFKENPKKFAPLYKGYCAYGVAMNKRVGSNPKAWDIVEGRLYLNLDRDVQGRWRQNMISYIKDANTNWPKLTEK